MKKFIATVLSLIVIISQFCIVGAQSCAPTMRIDDNEVTVTGGVRSHKAGEQVTILVLYPNKSLDDLNGDISEDVLYTNIAYTNDGGEYTFTFTLGDAEGVYKAYIRDINSSTLSELYITKNNSVKAEVSLGEVVVTGKTRSHKSDEQVNIVVLNPNKSLDDINNNVDDAILYTNAIKTGKGGEYRFNFKLGSAIGDYKIYVSDINKAELNEIFVTRESSIYAEIKTNELGNICFDYTSIPIWCTLFANADTDIEIVTDIYDNDTDKKLGTFKNDYKADEKGHMEECLNLDLSGLSKRFGYFRAECKITDKSIEKSIDKTIYFSSVNSPNGGVTNKKMGINHHWDYYDDEEYNKNIVDLFIKAGYSDFRTGLHWSNFEKNKLEYSIDKQHEKYLDFVKLKNGRLLITLSGTNSLYYDKDKDGNVISTTPNENTSFDAFGEYCYNLALYAKEYTHEYEVLNEFNMDGSYANPHGYGPDNYVKLLKKAYENIRRADPDAIVYGIDAAYVTSGYKYTTYEWIDAVMDIMKKDNACYMDALSFHIYTAGRTPEKGKKTEIVSNVRKILEKYGYGNMKIILTESGYSTDSWTEIQQAKFELRDWALLYDSVDKLYWYNAVEKDHQSPYEHYLGHIRMNESTELYQIGLPSEAKPVFLAMSNWNALLANSELVEKNITDDGSIYDYVFKTTDNNRIHMIWGISEGAVSHEFNIETGKIVKYDMYGNSEILNGDNGKYTLSVSDEPIYLKEASDIDVEFLSGNMITDKIGNLSEIAVNVNLTETVFEKHSALKVVIAEYSDGRLNGVDIKDVNMQNMSVGKKIKVDSADKISVYIWDGLKPIYKVYSIPKA